MKKFHVQPWTYGKGLFAVAPIAVGEVIAPLAESVSELWDSSATASWRSFFCVVGAKVGGWEQKMVPKASQRRKK
jgi:hypothetical protein